ncbi:hypothetical protein D0A34_26205 [Microcoleus vaginatus PCC 9802]|uniref:transposase family protein n=1 Tax=Microcoleus vaginatus TaxID=119532 RepID=UPI00020D29F9|nr:hypothetical protein MicvaDRAFT_0867 [Microcoleus vaginatus FGP-2]UNU21870.1 hypothetical protein D0A34_26205 [Microcoleus vaginatus PCC 9802]
MPCPVRGYATIKHKNLDKAMQLASLETSQRFQGDKAYVGEPLINTPHKKHRQEVLIPAQERANKSKAQIIIFVKYVIKLVKTFRVSAEIFDFKPQN